MYFAVKLADSCIIRTHSGVTNDEFLLGVRMVDYQAQSRLEVEEYCKKLNLVVLDPETWREYLELPGVLDYEPSFKSTRKVLDKWDFDPIIY